MARRLTGNQDGQVPADPSLAFSETSGHQLDQLVRDLAGRAHEVVNAQAKLRGLLRANATVVAELSLPVVLERIASAARELLHARYAAMGVIGPDGALEQFVHVGMDEETVRHIGQLPQGKGLLGALIDDPSPIRLPRISEDVRSVGFPAGHPPMQSFLGVAIRVRGAVFGNLYLSERDDGGEFSDEDEQLASALAATAGIAIENARLYEVSERHRRWLDASTEVTRALLGGSSQQSLELVTRHAARNAGAALAMLMLPVDNERLAIEAVTAEHRTVSDLAVRLAGLVIPAAESPAGQAIAGGAPVRSGHPGSLLREDVCEALLGPMIAVPLRAAGGVLGALCVVRGSRSEDFSDADVDMIAGFADHAALALELARDRSDLEALRVVEDHDRIAADLHDHVIQQLFSVGMGVQSVAAASTDERTVTRLTSFVVTLDETMARIRDTVYRLGPIRRDADLRTRLLGIVAEATVALGFEPDVRLAGALASVIDPALADDVVAVTREALSNCARHAQARSVALTVTLQDEMLTLEVLDDGRGVGSTTRSSGLTNMRRRAAKYGGTFAIANRETGGSRLTWTATVPAGSTV